MAQAWWREVPHRRAAHLTFDLGTGTFGLASYLGERLMAPKTRPVFLRRKAASQAAAPEQCILLLSSRSCRSLAREARLWQGGEQVGQLGEL